MIEEEEEEEEEKILVAEVLEVCYKCGQSSLHGHCLECLLKMTDDIIMIDVND